MSLLKELLEKNALIVNYNNEFTDNKVKESFINSIGESIGSIENRRVDGCCGNGGCTCNGSCRVENEIDEIEKPTPNSISKKPRHTV